MADSKALAKGTNHGGEQNEVFRTVGKHVEAMKLDAAEPDEEEESEDWEPKVVDEIESLCMHCEENGTTRLLLTKVPFFREIILMSFACPHCYFRNTSVQSAAEIAERGVKNVLVMRDPDDFQRQVVKSDTAVFRVEDLHIEIPPGRGKFTNVEGMLSEIRSDLSLGQKKRKEEAPDVYERIKVVVKKLADMLQGTLFPFTISLEDPAGNSWLEPSLDDTLGTFIRTEYARTAEQNAALGLDAGEDDGEEGSNGQIVPQVLGDEGGGMEGVEIVKGAMYELPCRCPGCTKKAQMNIQMVNIPFFKEVILSAVVCTICGYRTNDVKTGGEITEKGQRIWLAVKSPIDLHRDILKSETCMLKIPECKVEVVPGTMGGRFTTVEGLLTQIRDDLRGQIFDVDDTSSSGGDSMPANRKKGWEDFFNGLDKAINGQMEYTILMEDPLANSYVQNLCSPDSDPQIRTEEYTRTKEEEDELGITDMRTQYNADGEYTKETVKGQAPQADEAAKGVEHKPEKAGADAPAGVTDTAAETETVINDDFVLVEHGDAA
ncbi:MAG: zinc finger zpr1 [Lasallia pustulata]|uniref:Zinc finger zpr1 n=1 Tax=Lasallia pustulata TaxID=136370 RepID=A0A5M8PBV0_9LECA|nr:MAG: zinc finger zpr1 [Lasallia pustulata]